MKYFFSWLLMVLLGNSVAMAQWSVLGSRKFSASMYSQHRVVANRFGVFTAVSGASGVTAYRYNNNANRWDTLGNTNFTRGIVDEIALKNDTLLIAYQDLATRRIGVMQFANNAWSLVGGTFISDTTADDDCGLAIVNQQIHVAYQDRVGSTGKATVKRFNGSSWVVVGNQRFTTGNAWDIHLASVSNTPYISFREFISSTDNKVSVMALNGTTWSYVGSRGISINVAPNTSGRNELCYDTLQHKLYLVTAQKSGFPDGVGIFEWVESSWVNIGNITTSMLADNFYSVDYGKLAIHQGRPVVIVESGLGDITAFKYNGTTWQPFLNNTPINDSGTFDFDVCSYNDTLYVSYGDQRYTETPDGRTTVQRFFTGNSILHSNGLTLSGRRQPQTQLQWSTLSEQGTVNFIVEASTDNRQFVAIATVNASGYTNRTTTYQHTPNLSIMDKATFFRIRQVNMNGTTQYSNTIYLPLSTANLTVNVFPNPFIDKIQLQLHVSDASTVQLVLTNTYGQAIQQHVQQVTKGYNTLTVKAPSHLPQGTYFLEVRCANERYTFQLAH